MKFFKQENLKKALIINLCLMLIFVAIFLIITSVQIKMYSRIFNNKLDSVASQILERYPEIKENELIRIIKDEPKNKDKILHKYGYDDDIVAIDELKNAMNKSIIINAIFLMVFFVVALGIYIIYAVVQDKKIKEINGYLSGINRGDYSLKIEDNGEDELSKLRNELYKTTVLLKEMAENSIQEKENLSNSLADISHQLKTPLTSIRIMLDNINENLDMDKETRLDFLNEISKQIEWISSLVISLLKIAKFDAGTIIMENKDIYINDLVNNVIENLSILIEVREVKIVTDIPEDAKIIADYKWQLEAVTNIVKNAIEHSTPNTTIKISVENNSIFLKLRITNNGEGISKEDIKHIFERFYKAKNDKEESIGIGLSLAKTIIEKSNGYIKVESELNKETTFEIKYLK